MKFRNAICLLTATVMTVFAASANAITVEEGTNDFPSGSLGAPTFDLELGINTISGRHDGVDFDNFLIRIGERFRLTSILFDSIGNSFDFRGAEYVVFTDTFQRLGEQDLLEENAEQRVLTSVTPLVGGTYFFFNQDITIVDGGSFDDIDANWRFTFQVSEVPLPGTAPLLLGAVCLLGWSAKRRLNRDKA